MYNKLVQNIKENSVLLINDKSFRVLTKTNYANVKNKDLRYSKFLLDDKSILVVNPNRKTIFLGRIVKDFSKGESFPTRFVYKNKHYKKFEKDYQFVTGIEFGDFDKCEGECLWVDYVCEEDDNLCVDMGYVYKTKKRADIAARLLDIKDIKIKK